VALGPPAMAGAWMAAAGRRVHPVLLGAGVYLSLILTPIAASWGLEAAEQSRLARFLPWRSQRVRIEIVAVQCGGAISCAVESAGGRHVMTADEIIERIRQRIASITSGPTLHAADAGQLDSRLFELHLLYAEATDQYETWKAMRRREMAQPPAWLDRVRDGGIEMKPDMPEVVEFWKEFSDALGCHKSAPVAT